MLNSVFRARRLYAMHCLCQRCTARGSGLIGSDAEVEMGLESWRCDLSPESHVGPSYLSRGKGVIFPFCSSSLKVSEQTYVRGDSLSRR